MEFPWLKQFEVGEKRFWGGHLWSRGYFFRSVGSTTDQAVEFYIKISQDKKKREKYYSTGNLISPLPQAKFVPFHNLTDKLLKF